MNARRFGPYRVVADLGAGAQATVHLAEVVEETDGLEPGDRVALKILHEHLRRTPIAVERLRREVHVLKAIDHPNVVTLLDAGVIGSGGAARHYLATEYVEGQTLRKLLDDDGAQGEALCRFIGREAAQGLAAIHAAGVVHRDLKPENVILTREQKVKIMDLGVALVRDDLRVSRSGDFIGSVLHASPEQFLAGDRTIDGRADLYALGLIVYELVTGRHPFDGGSLAELMSQHLRRTPAHPSSLVPTISPFLDALLATLLAKSPAERPATATSVADALEGGEASTWWRAQERIYLDRARVFRAAAPREFALRGRDAELDRLHGVWGDVREGDGRALFVVGEAGIGKTRLVDEFAERVHTGGEEIHYLFGSALAGGAATAAGAFSSAFCDHLGRNRLEEALDGLLEDAPALVRPFAALLRGVPMPEGEPGLDTDGVHTAFVRVAQALAARQPTLIVIDDLHYAPPEGLALFAALAQAVVGHRILLVGAMRPGVAGEWRGDLARVPHVATLDLGRLGPEDVGALLHEALGSNRSARLLTPRVAALSDGNPLFVLETLRAHKQSGALRRREDGGWTLEVPTTALAAPPVVKELVCARVNDLEESDRELLDLAAVHGYRFEAAILADVLEAPRLGVLRSLERLARKHQLVVAEGRGYRFDHHLVQETLYELLPELLRTEYHAAIGTALRNRFEERPAAPDADVHAMEACRHLLEGDRGGKALRILDRALGHLEARHLHTPAVQLLDDVLAVPGLVEGRRRAELARRRLDHLQLQGRQGGMAGAVEAYLQLAREVGDPGLLTDAELRRARHLTDVGRHADALEAVERARVAAEELDGPWPLADALNMLGIIHLRSGRIREARDAYARSLELAVAAGDKQREAGARGNLAQPLLALGETEAALAEQRKCLDLLSALERPHLEAIAAGNLGNQLRLQGRGEEAEVCLQRSLEIARRVGARRVQVSALANLAVIRYEQGRLGDALDLLEDGLVLNDELGDRPRRLALLEIEGLVHYRLGRLESARRLMERVMDGWDGLGVAHAKLVAQFALAEIAADRGDVESARAFLEAAAETERAAGMGPTSGTYEASVGFLLLQEERREEALPCLETALQAAAGSPIDVKACIAALGGLDPRAVETELATRTDCDDLYALMKAHLWLGRATGRHRHFRRAHEMLERLASHAPKEDRAALARRLPLYRQITEAWRRTSGAVPTRGVGTDDR